MYFFFYACSIFLVGSFLVGDVDVPFKYFISPIGVCIYI